MAFTQPSYDISFKPSNIIKAFFENQTNCTYILNLKSCTNE